MGQNIQTERGVILATDGIKEDGSVTDYNVRSLDQMVLAGRSRAELTTGVVFTATPGTVTAGGNNTLPFAVPVPPGRRLIITNIIISCDGPGSVSIAVSPDLSSNWFAYIGAGGNMYGTNGITTVFGPNGGSNIIPIPNGYKVYENSVINASYRSFNTTARNISLSYSFLDIPNEPNPEAKYKISIFGDSTAWGNNLGNDESGRSFLGGTQWSEVFRDLCRKNGIDAQIYANNALDGRTMLEGAYNALTGLHRVKSDLTFVSFGMNDAISTKHPTEVKFKQAVADWISAVKSVNPGKSLVFIAPNQTDDPDRTGSGRIANIRTWLQAAASDITIGGGVINKVYFVDSSQAFALGSNQATDLNFKNTERVSGTSVRVHPSGLGSSIVGNYLWVNLKAPLFGK